MSFVTSHIIFASSGRHAWFTPFSCTLAFVGIPEKNIIGHKETKEWIRNFVFQLREKLSLSIPIYIQQDATLHGLLYLETALHVSGGASTHHQERMQLYLQHLVFVTPLLLSAAIVEELEQVWVCHPQHTQTGSISSTIAADSSNGVTNTRCCRYSCMRSWWWVEVPPEICRSVSRYNKPCNVASCWI